MQYLSTIGAHQSDIADLRQDIYMRVYDAAQKQIPERPKQLLFTSPQSHPHTCARRTSCTDRSRIGHRRSQYCH